jgi:hypothetical protein
VAGEEQVHVIGRFLRAALHARSSGCLFDLCGILDKRRAIVFISVRFGRVPSSIELPVNPGMDLDRTLLPAESSPGQSCLQINTFRLRPDVDIGQWALQTGVSPIYRLRLSLLR